MRLIPLLIFGLLIGYQSSAQQFLSTAEIIPIEEYENIHVQKLDDDPLTTTFMIWVKETVKEHYHAEHTEVVYVLEGSGLMTLGEEEKKITSGDYVFIPKGTHHSVQVIGDIPMKVLSIQTPSFDGKDRVFVTQE